MIVTHDPTAITRLFGPGMEDMDFTVFHSRTGNAYRVTCIVIREHDLEPCMVYRSVEEGTRWCRPLAQFFDTDQAGKPRWRWDEKTDRIMQMIRSALRAYDPEKLRKP